MKKLIMSILSLFLISGCQKEDELTKVINEGNYIIVDVRTPGEYSKGHVKGAINISHDTIDENVDLDKDKTIIVYCRSGNRSHQADIILTKLGYNVLDIGSYDSITLEKE